MNLEAKGYKSLMYPLEPGGWEGRLQRSSLPVWFWIALDCKIEEKGVEPVLWIREDQPHAGFLHFLLWFECLWKLLVPAHVLLSVRVVLHQQGRRGLGIPQSPGASRSTVVFFVVLRFRRAHVHPETPLGLCSGLVNPAGCLVVGWRSQLCIRSRWLGGNVIYPKPAAVSCFQEVLPRRSQSAAFQAPDLWLWCWATGLAEELQWN